MNDEWTMMMAALSQGTCLLIEVGGDTLLIIQQKLNPITARRQ